MIEKEKGRLESRPGPVDVSNFSSGVFDLTMRTFCVMARALKNTEVKEGSDRD